MTTPARTWYVERARIEQHHLPGRFLGRNVVHDSRNRLYPHQRRDRALTSQLWPRNIPILDQGDVGSCTGNEQVGALGTDPVFGALPAGHVSLDENEALALYSAAETIDGDGPYPPNDNGSSGPSAAQAALNMGLISGYTHCFSLADVLDALEDGPVGIGSSWYTSMDSPDASGLVVISAGATVRGGHEYICRGKDVDSQLLFFDNSWGPSFGVNGSFSYSYDTLTRLLSEMGDATVSLPLSVPAPTPVPVPPAPVPVPPPPSPGPAPPGPDAADRDLATATTKWAGERHVVSADRKIARALEAWLKAKGFTRQDES